MPAVPSGDAAFKGITLADSLSFTASPVSLSLAQQAQQRLKEKRKAEAERQSSFNNVLNDYRCSEVPLLGREVVSAVKAPR